MLMTLQPNLQRNHLQPHLQLQLYNRRLPESYILHQVYCEILVFASQALPFWHRKFIPTHYFSKTPSWIPFFDILCRLHSKIVDLGTASKSIGRQPKIYQVAPNTFIFHFYGNAFFPALGTLRHEVYWILVLSIFIINSPVLEVQ